MVNILFWISIYFILMFCYLLFFACASYNYNPCIVDYKNRITLFYDDFICRLESRGEKVPKLFFSKTILGSYFRHSFVKDYLMNENKLKELNFTDNEIKTLNELIVPGFKERIVLFDMLRMIFVFLIVIAGIIVGSFI